MTDYNETILQHFYHPHNIGSLDKNDINIGTGMIGSPACGDVLIIQIKVDNNRTITDTKFKAYGCCSAIASGSVATDWLKNKTLDQALSLKNSDIAAYLELPALKLHCSVLAEDVIKLAIQDYQQKQAGKTGL